MTSVAVISSAVGRINRLKIDVENKSEGLPKETGGLLNGLEEIQRLLVAAHDPKTAAAGSKFVDLEKQAVWLSYDIVDAITDAATFKTPMSFSRLLLKKPGYTGQLGDLQKCLTDLLDSLQKHKPASPDDQTNLQALLQNDKLPFLGDPSDSQYLLLGNEPASPACGSDLENPPKNNSAEEQKSENKQGQEELFEKLRTELLNPGSSSEVYLLGESGMGKSTLARKLFHDPQLRKSFESFAWVPLTHNFQIKDVLQHLLQQLDRKLDMSKMNKIDLVSRIFVELKDKRYLLVLEDIHSMDDWESIRLALPTAKSSRVIITSSNMDIKPPGTKDPPQIHHVSGLNETEIITLLNEKAAFKSDKVGKAIYDISGGSPLFATILGKSLRSANENENENEAQLVDELQSYKNRRGTPRVLEASYKRLDPEVKALLLYLGQFPPGQDVDIDKLYLLLSAENLIKEEDNISPQTLGEYLKELEGLKLVQVQQDHVVPTGGLYKSCRLQKQVWEFCKFKGAEEEFFEILDLGNLKKVGSQTRRLAVHLRADREKSATAQSIKPAALKRLLTLVIIDTFEKKSDWPWELNDLMYSSYLRILSFDGADFGVRGKLLKRLEALFYLRLFHLRFLSFRGCRRLEKLPFSLSSLTLLETLDLLVQDDCNMRIPNKIFANMKRMLHLYFPSNYESVDDGKPKQKLRLQGMKRLQILVNFDTGVCDAEDLNQFNELKILSTISKGDVDDALLTFLTQERGEDRHLQYSSVEITSFDCYNQSGLSRPRQLLGCRSVHSVRIEGRIGMLQEEGEGGSVMSCAIEEIVLDGSQLQHDPIVYLCKFQNLRSLVLSNDAFLGNLIDISAANYFPNLRSLKLHNLKFLKILTVQEKAVPKLSALQIHGCGSLEDLSIPKELEDRLQKAQARNGGDTYSVMPFPRKFNIVAV